MCDIIYIIKKRYLEINVVLLINKFIFYYENFIVI